MIGQTKKLQTLRFSVPVSYPYLLEVFVAVDELTLMWVLQFVRLHILPQSLDDDRSGLGMNAQHACQSGVQLKLRRLQRAQDEIT